MAADRWCVSDDPGEMLGILDEQGRKPSWRMARLFLSACCRSQWDRIDEHCRRAVSVADRLADRETILDLEDVRRRARIVSDAACGNADPDRDGRKDGLTIQYVASCLLYDGQPLLKFRPVIASWSRWMGPTIAHLLREIFGPVAPPATSRDFWRKRKGSLTYQPGEILRWNGGTIAAMAEGIYQDRAWEQLPILADALEDAGCQEQELLWHLRGLEVCPNGCECVYEAWMLSCPCDGNGFVPLRGPHVRGCWALDFLTGRE